MRYRRRRASLSPRRPSGDYAGEPRTVHQPSHRLLQLHRLLQQFLDTTTTPPQINTHTPNMLTRSTLTSSTRLSVAAARSLRAGSTWSQVPQGYVTDHLSFFRRSLAADACIATPIRRTRMMFKCWGGGDCRPADPILGKSIFPCIFSSSWLDGSRRSGGFGPISGPGSSNHLCTTFLKRPQPRPSSSYHHSHHLLFILLVRIYY